MYKITLPIDLNGSRYGIEFFRGVGKTDDERVANLLKDKGFEVERANGYEPEPQPEPEPPADPPRRGRPKAGE